MIVWATLEAGEDRAIDGASVLFAGHDHAATWAAKGFVSCGCDNVGKANWGWVSAASNKTRDVGNVGKEEGTALFGDLGEGRKVDGPRNCGATSPKHFWTLLHGHLAHLIQINAAGFFVDLVLNRVKEFARDAHFPPVGEVSTRGKMHSHDLVAGFAEG